VTHEPLPSARTVVERNVVIIEWTFGVFTIFWGVWWGFFIDKVVQTKAYPGEIFDIPVNLPSLLFVSAVLVALFTFYTVEWMWAIRSISARSPARRVLSQLKMPAILVGALCVVTWKMGTDCGIEPALMIYGWTLSALWFVVIVLMVLRH
jgi:hypothetical protein